MMEIMNISFNKKDFSRVSALDNFFATGKQIDG
jgi:hypothetical protein